MTDWHFFLMLPNGNAKFIFHFSLSKRILDETSYAFKWGDNLLQNAQCTPQTAPLSENLLQPPGVVRKLLCSLPDFRPRRGPSLGWGLLFLKELMNSPLCCQLSD